MEYRLAKTEDADKIYSLICEAIKEMESHDIFQWDEVYPTKEDFCDDIDKNSLYLAFEEEKLAAIYVISGEADEAYQKAKWENSDETAFVLHRFCVSPSFQNRGIGRQVLKHIEEQVREMGYESIRLDVFTQNPFALRLYRNNGYENRGYADWRKGRFELMEKRV